MRNTYHLDAGLTVGCWNLTKNLRKCAASIMADSNTSCELAFLRITNGVM